MKIKGFAALAPCAAALAASLTLAGQASATIYHLTYQGEVVSALDSTGEFGPGANLVGMAFTAHVTYDDAKAGATHSGGVSYDDYIGNGAANPLTASILLNGVTKTFGETSGRDSRTDRSLLPDCTLDCTDASFQQNASDVRVENLIYTLNYINLGGMSSDGSLSGLAHTAPNYTNPPVSLYAYVSLSEQDMITLAARRDASVFVRIDSVTGGERGGVPEPATWAMMLLGFGGMGALLRRRRAIAFAPA